MGRVGDGAISELPPLCQEWISEGPSSQPSPNTGRRSFRYPDIFLLIERFSNPQSEISLRPLRLCGSILFCQAKNYTFRRAEGFASVADGVFRFGGKFGHGFVELGEVEDRVVAEALIASGFVGDLAFA